jgi:hypothetical protein
MTSTERNRYRTWKNVLSLDLTDEKVLDNIIEINYSKALPKTKEYIKSQIRLQGRDLDVTGFRSIILKEDFIDAYNKSRENYSFKPNYDFSLLPDIIGNKLEKVTVICRNTICGIEVGEFETSFSNLIDHKRDVFRISALEKDVNPDLKENPEKTKKFKEEVIKLYGPDRFNLDSVHIIESYSIFPVKIFCNTCKKFFWVQSYYFLKGNGCEHCNLEQKAKDAQRVTFEVWRDRAIEIHGNKYDYTLAEEEFVNQYSPVHIKCNTCGTIFEQVPFGHVIKEDTRCPCPECRKVQVSAILSKDGKSTWERLVEICGPDYDFSGVSKGIGRRDTIEYKKISTGEIFTTKVENILSGHIEPGKSKSTGEILAENWLTSHKILFKTQVRVRGIQGREQNYVIVDFEIEDKNIIIEINGRQHYCEDSFAVVQKYSDRYTFEQQLTRDRNVKQYCLDNNITFIEIPYTYFTYKKIDDILTKIILNNESPDFIEIPEIKYC